MTQEQYNVIVKTLQNGVPALANELIDALNEIIETNQELNKKENVDAKTEE